MIMFKWVLNKFNFTVFQKYIFYEKNNIKIKTKVKNIDRYCFN
jgi:hypothetical protein